MPQCCARQLTKGKRAGLQPQRSNITHADQGQCPLIAIESCPGCIYRILGGDAAKDFPNLAAFPPVAWRGMTFNNRLFGIPLNYSLSLYNLWVHAELLDPLGGQMPKTADDFKRALTQISKDGNAISAVGG